MRQACVVVVSLAAAALCAGCEQGGGATALGGRANALVGDEADAGISSTAAAEEPSASDKKPGPPYGGDGEERQLSVAWTDGAESASVAKLSFVVTNITADAEIELAVSVVCKSLIGEEEKKVGNAKLGPGESREFKLAASALPIRSAKVVSQMFVRLTRGEPSVSSLEAMRYYRHERGHVRVRAYTEAQLASELGGALFQSDVAPEDTNAAALSKELLGEKQADGKKAESVSLATSGLVDYDEAGNVAGVISSYSTGSADASGEGMILVYPDEPDAGTEVDHE